MPTETEIQNVGFFPHQLVPASCTREQEQHIVSKHGAEKPSVDPRSQRGCFFPRFPFNKISHLSQVLLNPDFAKMLDMAQTLAHQELFGSQ